MHRKQIFGCVWALIGMAIGRLLGWAILELMKHSGYPILARDYVGLMYVLPFAAAIAAIMLYNQFSE